MLSAFLGVLLKIAIPVVAVSAARKGYESLTNYKSPSDKAYEAYLSYQNALDAAGYDYDIKYLLGRLEGDGKITVEQKKSYIELIERAEKAYGNGHGLDDTLYDNFKTKKTHAKMEELYTMLAEEIPEIRNYTASVINTLPEDIRQSFYKSVPKIADVIAPSYEDTDFEGEQLEVEPVKLWSGQELADLHNIDYNPETYYNLIKQSAEANLDLANYTSAQVNQASMVDDTQNVTSYLDSIRNTKANAIASGATLGQRAANEVLNNTEAFNNYAANQAAVAQDRLALTEQAILDNAQAKLSARQYFDSLAQSLANDSILLYGNDTERFAQELASNAEMYRADQELRGQRAYANGQMAGAYAQAQAAINAARNSVNGTANEYAWVFDRFLGANNGNVDNAIRDMDTYLFSKYTGSNNLFDYIKNTGS